MPPGLGNYRVTKSSVSSIVKMLQIPSVAMHFRISISQLLADHPFFSINEMPS